MPKQITFLWSGTHTLLCFPGRHFTCELSFRLCMLQQSYIVVDGDDLEMRLEMYLFTRCQEGREN